jgi:hypothetical protein
MTFNFNVGDLLTTGEFSTPNHPALIIDKQWDEGEENYIYCIQYLHNGAIDWLIRDTIIALSYEV